MRYDVIVAGAGPAGSTAAREAAERGLSVLMLDRAEFPRDKPCGGGVNIRAARLLPFSLDPVAEREIVGMRISVKQAAEFDQRAGHTLTYLTQRRRLDAFLAQKAVDAGVRFEEHAGVRAVERHASYVTVRAGKETYEGRTLVAADGANGPSAKLAGMSVARGKGIALEGNLTPRHGFPEQWQEMFGIDVGNVPGGYGWLFPKGDHLNIGVGGDYRVGPSLRTRLDALTQYYGFDPGDLWGVRGHPLPVRQRGAAVSDGNVVVVGDAAGLLDPLTGEGIYGAIRSGIAAARTIADFLEGTVPNLDGYRREVEEELIPDLETSGQLRDFFYLSPVLCAQIVRRWPRAWHLICNLITGDATYAGFKYGRPGLAPIIDGGSTAIRAMHRVHGHARLQHLRSAAVDALDARRSGRKTVA